MDNVQRPTYRHATIITLTVAGGTVVDVDPIPDDFDIVKNNDEGFGTLGFVLNKLAEHAYALLEIVIPFNDATSILVLRRF